MEEICPPASFSCDDAREFLGHFSQRFGPVALCHDCYSLLVKTGEIW